MQGALASLPPQSKTLARLLCYVSNASAWVASSARVRVFNRLGCGQKRRRGFCSVGIESNTALPKHSSECKYPLLYEPCKAGIEQELECGGWPIFSLSPNCQRQRKCISPSTDQERRHKPVSCARIGRHWGHENREGEEKKQKLRNFESDVIGLMQGTDGAQFFGDGAETLPNSE